ncbi:sporulation protein YpjB [Sutcliffiella cohnii]
MMVRLLIGIIAIFLCFPITQVTAADSKPYEKLNDLLETSIQLSRQERYVEAHNLLEIFMDEFSKVMTTQKDVKMDDVRVIMSVHSQTKDTLMNGTVPHEEKVRNVMMLRLAVDAMSSEHQPLWTEMEEPIITTFQQLKHSVESKDENIFGQHYYRLIKTYNLILPSLRMDVKPEYIAKVDAHLQYLDQNKRTIIQDPTKMEQLNAMETDFRALFEQLKEDETDPSLLWVMISTGSIILLTLSYVAWRRYEAENRKRKRKKQKD